MKALKDDKLEIDILKSMTYSEINELMISLHFKNQRLTEQLRLHGVGNCKREDTLKYFKEMNELFLEAIKEVENGIYDPVEEFGKELADKYIIIKK